MKPVRLGAVEYLNARPLVFRLDRSPRFVVRFDWPSRCAALLHDNAIDVGLIPSIEYLRPPASAVGSQAYRIVPDLAIASHGPVASVAIYTTRAIADVRSIALDTSSRTSVALTRVLSARVFGIEPDLRPCAARSRSDAGQLRCGADHRRQGTVDERWPAAPRRPRGGGRENRFGRGVDRCDRLAVRVRLLGRPVRNIARRRTSRSCSGRATGRRSSPKRCRLSISRAPLSIGRLARATCGIISATSSGPTSRPDSSSFIDMLQRPEWSPRLRRCASSSRVSPSRTGLRSRDRMMAR